MGTFLKAHCPSCNFTAGFIQFGHGMVRRVPLIPAWNTDTEMLVAAEENDPRALKYYHDRTMYRDPINEKGIQGGDIWLSRKGNWCPGCGEREMRFEEVGEWD